jgi:uracil-DNA glycosylase
VRLVRLDGSFKNWRDTARELLREDVDPSSVQWSETANSQEPLGNLFNEQPAVAPGLKSAAVPKAFPDLARLASCHRDPARWQLLYRVLYRLAHGEKHLLEIASDPDVNELILLTKDVRRDMHKMRAFVRFRKTGDDYVAWYRPDHHILEANAPFFVERFGSMRFAILTPDKSAFWDTAELRIGPGVPRSESPSGDELEILWLTYYSSIFNPARVKVKAMKAEMPIRHWGTLPEAVLIPDLLLQAESRVHAMAVKQPPSANLFVPATSDLKVLRVAAQSCEGCDLFRNATQAVFGEGTRKARVMFVGEQPGDQEDLAGRPFVGPAGQVLDRALAEAGIDRSEVYVTNAVKHFKFVERGKRRIHEKPNGTEIAACRPWLEAEVRIVKPQVLVCLGATAGQSVFGRAVKVMSERGEFLKHPWAESAFPTIHPSMILRIPDSGDKEKEYKRFAQDLKKVASAIGKVD